MKYGIYSSFDFHQYGEHILPNIEKSLMAALNATNISIKYKLLQAAKTRYQIVLDPSKEIGKISIEYSPDGHSFILNPNTRISNDLSFLFERMWPNFLLKENIYNDIASYIKNLS